MNDDESIAKGPDGQPVIQVALLAELRNIQRGQAAGFAEVKTALNGKADKADVARLETRLDDHATKIAGLEGWKHDQRLVEGVNLRRDRRAWTAKEKAFGVVGTLLVVAGSILGPYIGNHI